MRVDIKTGKLIVDNEDYRIPHNVMQVDELANHVVFRCLTDDNQLFGAAVPKSMPDTAQMVVGAEVLKKAKHAPRHDGTHVFRPVGT